MDIFPFLLIVLAILPSATLSFECLGEGRFSNPEDEACGSYYLCTKLSNGTYVSTYYHCPGSAVFHAESQQCSIYHKCQKELQFECTTSGRFVDPTDDNCRKYYLCSALHNGSYIRTLYSCPNGSRFDPIMGKCSAGYECGFSCVKRGRYKDPDDLTCSNYFLCSELRNGTFIRTKYKCPKNSFFDPEGERCTATYVCPTDFRCEKKGRFPDSSDPTSKNYFLCSQLRNGTFIKTKYVCPKQSRFDPGRGMCSADSPATTTERTTEEHCVGAGTTAGLAKSVNGFLCGEKGRFRDPADHTCKLYYLCSRLHNGTFVPTKYRCPEGSRFDPQLGKCSALYVCTGGATTTPEVGDCAAAGDDGDPEKAGRTKRSDQTTVHANGGEEDADGDAGETTEWDTSAGDEDDFVCGAKGRFADLSDWNCARYFLCSKMTNGTFIQTRYNCPDGTRFDPAMAKCSRNYLCPQGTTASDESSNTAEVLTPFDSDENYSWSGSDEESLPVLLDADENSYFVRTTKPTRDFVCPAEGRFTDVGDASCKIYFLCSQTSDESLVATRYQCPRGSFFDPQLGKCRKGYQCPYPSDQNVTETSDISLEDKMLYAVDEDDTPVAHNVASSPFSNPSTHPEPFNLYGYGDQTPVGSTNAHIKSSSDFSNPVNNDPYPYTHLVPNEDRYKYQEHTAESEIEVSSDYGDPIGSNNYEGNTIASSGGTDKITEVAGADTLIPVAIEVTRMVNTSISSTVGPIGNSKTTPSGISISSRASNDSSPPTKPDTQEFVCEKNGRHADPNDPTRTQYFLCSRLRNGTFLKTNFTCPRDTVFNTDTNKCSSKPAPTTPHREISYRIEDSEEDASTPDLHDILERKTPSYETESQDPYDIFNWKKYSPATISTTTPVYGGEETVSQDLYEIFSWDEAASKEREEYTNSPLGSLETLKNWDEGPNSDMELSDDSYKTTNHEPGEYNARKLDPPSSGIEDEGSSHDQKPSDATPFEQNYYQAFECVTEGRFSDSANTRYIHCSQLANGTFAKNHYNCPQDTFFNPGMQRCTANQFDDFVCTKAGRFVDRRDPSKRSYYFCISDDDGATSFSRIRYICPDQSIFDEALQRCSPFAPVDDLNFVCTEIGRFPEVSDASGRKYIMCSQLRNKTFVKSAYSCPPGSRFDPEQRKCSRFDEASNFRTKRSEFTTTDMIELKEDGEPTITTHEGKNKDEEENLHNDYVPATNSKNESAASAEHAATTLTGKYLANDDLEENLHHEEAKPKIVTEVTPDDEPRNASAELVDDLDAEILDDLDAESAKTASVNHVNEVLDDLKENASKLSDDHLPARIISVLPLRCRSRGYLKNEDDPSGQTYFFCDITSDGTLFQYELKCPEAYVFDPSSKLCSPGDFDLVPLPQTTISISR